MVTKFGKITIGATLLVIATYLWKIALILLVLGLCVRLVNRHKKLNRSEKWH